ncbi:MAG: hypothetical protein ACWA5T_08310 [Parvularcula sp.]
MTFFSTLILGAALAAAQPPSDAAVSGWELESFKTDFDMRGSADKDYQYSGVRVSTTDPTQPQITLGCSKRTGIVATFFFTPLNSRPEKQKRYLKFTSVREQLQIGDETPQTIPFTRFQSKDVFQTRKKKSGARVFNAVVNGKTVTVGKTIFHPPPVDDDFRAFAKICKTLREADTE